MGCHPKPFTNGDIVFVAARGKTEVALTTAARLKVVSALDRKHVPFARDAFKGFAATVAKAQAGTCYQIF
jgi:hypothetical protein